MCRRRSGLHAPASAAARTPPTASRRNRVPSTRPYARPICLLARTEPGRCLLIDATEPKGTVAERIWKYVSERLDPVSARRYARVQRRERHGRPTASSRSRRARPAFSTARPEAEHALLDAYRSGACRRLADHRTCRNRQGDARLPHGPFRAGASGLTRAGGAEGDVASG